MDRIKYERSALVLYGSETGNAFDYAHEVGDLIERLRFSAHVTHLDAVEPTVLSRYSVVAIIISTTGQGDIPANARHFWKSLLRRKLPPTFLNGVQFTTFGLGDSSYPKFNWAARKLHKRLVQLGAGELYPRGEADEQHEEGLDASFVPWSTNLRRHLLGTFPLRNGLKPISEGTLLEPKWVLGSSEHGQTSVGSPAAEESLWGLDDASTRRINGAPTKGQDWGSLPVSDERFKVTLDENVRVTSDLHWQDVRRLVFSTPSSIPYEPGDVLTIYPRNASEDVQQLISAMDWGDIADLPIRFVGAECNPGFDSHHPLPSFPAISAGSITTLRDLLIECLDLNAIPKRSFFSKIAHFTEDARQKDRLLEFTKPEYIDELHDYTTRPRRSILEVLQEFDTVRIPWQWAANILPELRGRQFSIASGGEFKCNSRGHTRFELLVAIVRYKTVIKKTRQGVCTRYLASLPPGTSLDVSLQKGSLGITEAQAQHPLILIGSGTGIAPLRSLIWERLKWEDKSRNDPPQMNDDKKERDGHNRGEIILFFGCRKKGADYFYHEEWEQLTNELPLAIFPAFSQDQRQKVYVQDLIKEQSQLVCRLLCDEGGTVYVCGSSGKMPQAVRVALTETLTTSGSKHQGDAEAYLQAMEREGRYKQETW